MMMMIYSIYCNITTQYDDARQRARREKKTHAGKKKKKKKEVDGKGPAKLEIYCKCNSLKNICNDSLIAA